MPETRSERATTDAHEIQAAGRLMAQKRPLELFAGAVGGFAAETEVLVPSAFGAQRR